MPSKTAHLYLPFEGFEGNIKKSIGQQRNVDCDLWLIREEKSILSFSQMRIQVLTDIIVILCYDTSMASTRIGSIFEKGIKNKLKLKKEISSRRQYWVYQAQTLQIQAYNSI